MSFCFASENTIVLTSKVIEATIFLEGSEIKKRVETNLDIGENHLIITGIPKGVKKEELRINSNSNYSLKSFYFKDNIGSKLSNTSSKMDVIKEELQLLKIDQKVLQEEQVMLLSNKQIGGEKGVQVQDLKTFSKYYRNRLRDIEVEMLRLNNQISKKQQSLIILSDPLRIYNDKEGNGNQYKSLYLEIINDEKQDVILDIIYWNKSSYWYPSYDLAVKDLNDDIELTMKANIIQLTNETWSDVKIKLSTGNPMIKNKLPIFKSTILDTKSNSQSVQIKREIIEVQIPGEYKTIQEKIVNNGDTVIVTRQILAENPIRYELVGSTEKPKITSIEYELKTRNTLISNKEPFTIGIKEFSLKGNFQYYCLPKFDTNVYLTANIENWNSLNLMNGDVKVFYQNDLVGHTEINTSTILDVLNIVIGVDKEIAVKRESFTNYKEDIGSNTNINYRNDKITISNKKKQSITILVEDQIPISQTSDIKINAKDLSNGSLNKNNGKISWNINLNTLEKRDLDLKYEITYPNNKTLYTKKN